MKKLIGMVIIVMGLAIRSSDACYDPQSMYYAGVVLNNGVEINYERLEALAGDAEAYIRECFLEETQTQDGGDSTIEIIDSVEFAAKERRVPMGVTLCSYKLRSVYDDDVMVFIGHVEGMFDLFSGVPRLIVYFPVDSTDIPTTDEKAAAVAAELRRFADLGIITIADEIINKAETALVVADGQYWIEQDSVLAFNMWFSGEGVNGVRALDGVKGTYGCGSGVAYELPAEGLTGTAQSGILKSQKETRRLYSEITGNIVSIHYSKVTSGNAVMKIFDMQARLVDEIILKKYSTSVKLGNGTGNRMAPGCYMLSISDEGKVLQRGTVTLYR